MKTFQKILVPIDFSPGSAEAIRHGVELSKRYQASLTLLHVFEVVAYALPEGFVLYTSDQFQNLLRQFETKLTDAKREALALGATTVDTKTVQGSPWLEIVDFAKSNDFDLIVMGTHGRTGLKHVLMGSVAEKVARHAQCPVLITRQQSPS